MNKMELAETRIYDACNRSVSPQPTTCQNLQEKLASLTEQNQITETQTKMYKKQWFDLIKRKTAVEITEPENYDDLEAQVELG